jgi:Chitin binding Peritrophin-A domain
MKSLWKHSVVLLVSLIGLNSLNVSGESAHQFNDLEGICTGIDLGFLPDPRTCRGFILCIFGLPSEITCPPATPVYDPAQETCVEGNHEKDARL